MLLDITTSSQSNNTTANRMTSAAVANLNHTCNMNEADSQNVRTRRRASNFKDLTGLRFERLIVTNEASPLYRPNGETRLRWNCICDCGGVACVMGDHLRDGHTGSCGCVQRERTAAAKTTHGHKKGKKPSRTYQSYISMIERCENKNIPSYYRYGGRGIRVCNHWRESFQSFLEDMGERPTGRTLDRFPNKNGNYAPENCRWATPREQAQNTRKNVLTMELARKIRDLFSRGFRKCDIAEQLGLTPSTVRNVLCRGNWAETA